MINNSISEINRQLFSLIAAGHSPNAEALLLASFLAEYGGWLAFGSVIAFMGFNPSKIIYLLCAIFVSASTAIVAHAIADNIGHPRPFTVGLSPMYLNHSDRGSLPSAHATVIFTLAVICFLDSRFRLLGIWVGVLALATCWSRVYTGLHFPLDIFAGMFLATLIAFSFPVTRMSISYFSRLLNYSNLTANCGNGHKRPNTKADNKSKIMSSELTFKVQTQVVVDAHMRKVFSASDELKK